MAARRARRSPRAGGQHFLRSPRLAAELVRDAAVEPTDWVFELGAGSGRLTAPLADCAGRVDAVELDPVWAARLRDRFAGRSNVRVIEDDAARVRLPGAAFRVVANLPFDRTGALLRRLLDEPRLPLQRADLIVEWGVALKRTVRWPSTMANVLWGARYEIVLVRRLPAPLFEPQPRVDAGLLRIVRRPNPLVPLADHERFRAVLQTAFRSRRPTLRQALAGWISPRGFKHLARELGFDSDSAPRDLDLYQWTALFRAVRSSR